MANEILLPIALPHGVVAPSRGRLSVYLAPRARSSGPLSATDWHDWPQVVGALDLAVAIDGNAVPSGQVDIKSQPDSAVWKAVFADDTPWDAWDFVDRRDRAYLTLPEQALHGDIVAAYTDVGNAVTTTIPTVAELGDIPAAADLLGAGGAARERLAQARAFTTRLAGVSDGGAGQGIDTIDFAQALSLLGRHPHLLRLLGIVVDVEIPLPATATWVQVSTNIMSRPGNTVRELAVRTCVDADFWPHDGYENLVDAGLLQIDVLGAAGRLSELVRTLDDSDQQSSAPAALPSLDDLGVALTRTDALATLQGRAERMSEIERDIERVIANRLDVVDLCGGDVVVGHRIDVGGPTRPFRSLHQRVSDDGYVFPRDRSLTIIPEPDENWVSTTLGTEATQTSSRQRARPVLHRWAGWSAAAPPPGRVLDPVTGEAVDPPRTSPVEGPAQFQAEYRVLPGTLPRLRYGAEYVLRARLVDISGVSRDVTDSGGRPLSPPAITYGRWAAVASPAVVRRHLAPVPGVDDTPTQMVIRSELDQDDDTVTPADRLLFPPVGTQQVAERHGVPGGGASPAAYAELAARDGRSLTDDTSADPVTSERIVVTPAASAGPDVLPGPEQLTVSYLPDPAGTGVSLTGVPGVVGPLALDWRGAWPALSTQRLVLAAGPEGTSLVDADDAVEVRLPKAGCIDVEVACTVAAPFSHHFGVLASMRATRTPDEVTALDRQVRDGRVWLVSARKVVSLIHAVRVPLTIPVVSDLVALRRLEGRHTRIRGVLAVDRASTRRVTLRGTWVDTVDDPAEAGPRDVHARAVIGKVGVDKDGDPLTADVDLRWRVDDTRHREVTVTAEAFSRFSRHFTEQDDVVMGDAPVVLDRLGVVPGSVSVSQADVAFSAGADYVVDGPAGSITRTDKSAITLGSTVTVRWIPLPTSRRSDEDGSQQYLLEVANTLPPTPPTVIETLPAFDRRHVRNAELERVRHVGSVVRVWLGRGWFASGAGELLGVVCDPSTADVSAYSVAGKDPVFTSDDPTPITPASLSRSTTTGEGLVALDGATVDVAGHDVDFEPDLGRWYADVAIDDDRAYLPFVRLVVCRYQPHSVEGAHLSPMIVTDPLRLGPTRTSTVRVTDAGRTIKVAVIGQSHHGVPDPADPTTDLHNEVTAWIERRDPKVGDRDLGWSPIDGPVVMSRSRSGRLDVWTHAFATPSGGFPDADEIRVRLEEREPLLAGPADAPGVTRRPVFVETLRMPAAAFATRQRTLAARPRT